jgi:hypothetical protein
MSSLFGPQAFTCIAATKSRQQNCSTPPLALTSTVRWRVPLAQARTSITHSGWRKTFRAAYILDQFPIVRQKDEQAHGCYRTKERILETYDTMLDAQRRGQSYRTTLTPPPGQR